MKSRAATFSPFPIVDLREPSLPSDGLLIRLPAECTKHFQNGEKCRTHYASLAIKSAKSLGSSFQCPYGFASFPFKIDKDNYAFTGFIPFPRIGGKLERAVAKRYSKNKIDMESVHRAVDAVKSAEQALIKAEEDVVLRNSAALHEIRKLNGKIKQNAERLYEESKSESEAIAQRALTMYRASEIMSKQFDVLEIIANQDLAKLSLNTTRNLHDVIHKCRKIYEGDTENRIRITGTQNYHPRVVASDKTFEIIPTVLIHNALKYARADSPIEIKITKFGSTCEVAVKSESSGTVVLDDTVFDRGVRFGNDSDGSGNGLFVAQLVAKQHDTKITVESRRIGEDRVENIFKVFFATLGGSDMN